jgi:hypothetical protein
VGGQSITRPPSRIVGTEIASAIHSDTLRGNQATERRNFGPAQRVAAVMQRRSVVHAAI